MRNYKKAIENIKKVGGLQRREPGLSKPTEQQDGKEREVKDVMHPWRRFVVLGYDDDALIMMILLNVLTLMVY